MNISLGMNMKARMNVALNRVFSRIVDGDAIEPVAMPSLPEVVEQARQEYLNAQYYYNTVTDKDLVDHAVYVMHAAEKKYMYLLKQAREQGVTYSPYAAKIDLEEKTSNIQG
ncbi:DUF2508 family protein [Dendrosporobacter sp. 1207_IL3150]|uniref:DUF2508 family protein n=1 Tax=Dendrosporobacter sp. 1207_IL3150 TaxID=3084054 RepID=UPI002FDB11D6